MKVKEALSKDFAPEETGTNIIRSKGMEFVEEITYIDGLSYSNYYIKDYSTKEILIRVNIPNPRAGKTVYKDIFLKYQTGMRKFLVKLFDVLTGEKEDIATAYKTKQPTDLEVLIQNDVVYLVLYNDDEKEKFAFINFSSKEKSLVIAENIVSYFEGIPIDKTWREICEQ